MGLAIHRVIGSEERQTDHIHVFLHSHKQIN